MGLFSAKYTQWNLWGLDPLFSFSRPFKESPNIGGPSKARGPVEEEREGESGKARERWKGHLQ